MIFELHENQTGQQQHSQSSSWFQAVSFHSTVLYTHTLTHTRTRTHQHAQGFSSPPHSNLLPVWELSSSRLDWQKLNKLPCRSASFVSISPTADGASACPGQSSSRRHPARTFRSYPPPTRATNHQHLVVRALSTRQPVRDCRRADSGVQPRRLSGALRCLLSASPATRKSRLWRHTMWKGGRFKKEKNASKNNKSQL